MITEGFKDKYEQEIKELSSISLQIRSGYAHLGYVDTFPKTCMRCQRVYRNADEFYTSTRLCETQPSPSSQMKPGFERELRTCPCGAVLISLSMSDRRNLSEAGHRRRALFDEWYEKLIESAKAEENVRSELRKIFRMFEEDRVPVDLKL